LRDRQMEAQTDGDAYRWTHRQLETQTWRDGQTETQTDGDTDRWRASKMVRQKCIKTVAQVKTPKIEEDTHTQTDTQKKIDRLI